MPAGLRPGRVDGFTGKRLPTPLWWTFPTINLPTCHRIPAPLVLHRAAHTLQKPLPRALRACGGALSTRFRLFLFSDAALTRPSILSMLASYIVIPAARAASFSRRIAASRRF